MADPECFRKFSYQPSCDFRRNPSVDYRPRGFNNPFFSRERRDFERRLMNRGSKRMRGRNKGYYDDDTYYMRERSMRYSGNMFCNMFDDEDRDSYSRFDRDQESVSEKELENEPDEFVKTKMTVTMIEKKMERLHQEMNELKDENEYLARENFQIREVMDELGIPEEHRISVKKSKSPNVPIIRSSAFNTSKKHKKARMWQNQLRMSSDDGFRFATDREDYDYDDMNHK